MADGVKTDRILAKYSRKTADAQFSFTFFEKKLAIILKYELIF